MSKILLQSIFITSLLMLVVSLFFVVPRIEAAKKFVPKRKPAVKISTGSIPAIVRYRADHLGILMSFSNFSGIESVSYSFTYNTNGMPQGAGGKITSANNPTAQRELLFGTCSSGVCRYHSNLSNARLVLTATMTNGRTITKGYKIKTYN